MELPENILQFIWKFRLYKPHQLTTTSGASVSVLVVGQQNQNAGPDFLNSHIRIGETEWFGHVELHVHSSSWNKHQHHKDPAYNNVILHVVYEHDQEIERADGTRPPTVRLKEYIADDILSRCRQLMDQVSWIPCEKLIGQVSEIKKTSWLSRLSIERLAQKVSQFNTLLESSQNDWELSTYRWIARAFGFKTNADAFEQLAERVPYKLIAKYQSDLHIIEALLFGQAGFLNDRMFVDAYPQQLQQTYLYYRKLHGLQPMDVAAWKFMRMRPGNFPTLRIAQLAGFCHRQTPLYARILENDDEYLVNRFYSKIPINNYWADHYQFDKPSARHSVRMGKLSMQTLLINTVPVILFAHAGYVDKETYIYRAVGLLEKVKAEENSVVQRFGDLGILAAHAGESQALLQLKSSYCDLKKCLDCEFGLTIVAPDKSKKSFR